MRLGRSFGFFASQTTVASNRTYLDSREFSKAAREFLAAGKKSMETVLKDQARLFVRDATKFTAPTGKAPINESWAAQRKAGLNAIKKDLLGGGKHTGDGGKKAGIFLPTPVSMLKNKPSENTVRLFATKSGRVYGVEKNLFRPKATIGEMHAHHKKYRTADGRVTRAQTGDRTIGRWKFIDKMAISKQSFNAYMKWIGGRVGMGKGGWVRAAEALGLKLPGWITKHRSGGIFQADLGAKSTMTITVGNVVGFIQRSGAEMGVIKRALANRTRSMQVQTKAIFDKLAKKHEGRKR